MNLNLQPDGHRGYFLDQVTRGIWYEFGSGAYESLPRVARDYLEGVTKVADGFLTLSIILDVSGCSSRLRRFLWLSLYKDVPDHPPPKHQYWEICDQRAQVKWYIQKEWKELKDLQGRGVVDHLKSLSYDFMYKGAYVDGYLIDRGAKRKDVSLYKAQLPFVPDLS